MARRLFVCIEKPIIAEQRTRPAITALDAWQESNTGIAYALDLVELGRKDQ
jgi:hypothetical protein